MSEEGQARDVVDPAEVYVRRLEKLNWAQRLAENRESQLGCDVNTG